MSRRTAGLIVVLTVIGVAFVLEGWTFLDLITMQLSDDETEQTVETSRASSEYVGPGDVIELGTSCTARIDQMYVHAGTARWQFRITVTFTNSGTKEVHVKSQNIGLTSGKTLPLEHAFSVSAESTVTRQLSAEIPQGTEVEAWTVRWTGNPEEGEWTERTVSLDKAPVRRRKK